MDKLILAFAVRICLTIFLDAIHLLMINRTEMQAAMGDSYCEF